VALGATVIGYLADRSTVPERILTGMAAALLITPENITDIVGLGLLLLVYVLQKLRRRRIRPPEPEAVPGSGSYP